jgi:subtilisin family serine protease
MKKITIFTAFTLLFVAACSEEQFEETKLNQIEFKDVLTTRQINDVINQTSQKEHFTWQKASLHQLWSAVKQGNDLVSIGFGDNKNDFDKSTSRNANQIETNLLSLIAKYEHVSIDKILVDKSDYLNQFDILIKNPETLLALRNNKNVRYVEPADYRYFDHEPTQRSSSGCGYGSSTISTADFTPDNLTNSKIPWTFAKHSITQAWSKGVAGQGITVGIIDTGLSSTQSLMNGSGFASGLSSGRTVQRFGVFVDSIWPWSTATDGVNDLCGHGTSMASAATAPRSNSGMPVGVAYRSNLISYRAAEDVVLNGYHEQRGVQRAFEGLGNNANVRIISMSMGHIFSVGRIEDGVRYANNRGKLIFCAGGTSTSFTTFVGVIFPAWMPETVAVTGIKEASTYQKCDVCHTGSEIDFTIMLEKAVTNKHVPVLSFYNNQADYVGGSSIATATTAGIAALVWSKYPTWSKAQVLSRMRASSQFNPKHSQFGHGMINANLATN